MKFLPHFLHFRINTTLFASFGFLIGTAVMYILALANQILKRPKNRRPGILQGFARPSILNRTSPRRRIFSPYINSQIGLTFEYPTNWRMEELVRSSGANVRMITLTPPVHNDFPSNRLQYQLIIIVESLTSLFGLNSPPAPPLSSSADATPMANGPPGGMVASHLPRLSLITSSAAKGDPHQGGKPVVNSESEGGANNANSLSRRNGTPPSVALNNPNAKMNHLLDRYLEITKTSLQASLTPPSVSSCTTPSPPPMSTQPVTSSSSSGTVSPSSTISISPSHSPPPPPLPQFEILVEREGKYRLADREARELVLLQRKVSTQDLSTASTNPSTSNAPKENTKQANHNNNNHRAVRMSTGSSSSSSSTTSSSSSQSSGSDSSAVPEVRIWIALTLFRSGSVGLCVQCITSIGLKPYDEELRHILRTLRILDP